MSFTESRLNKLEDQLLTKPSCLPTLFICRNDKGEYDCMENISKVLFTGTEQQCKDYAESISGKRTVIIIDDLTE